MIRAMGGTGSARAAPAPRFAQWRRRPLPRSESYRRERGAGLLGWIPGVAKNRRRHSLRSGRPPPCGEREVMRIGSRFWGGEPLPTKPRVGRSPTRGKVARVVMRPRGNETLLTC